MNDPLLDHFRSQWKFVRGLTNDFLGTLSDDDLLISPGERLGAWWKQFRHVGRVQENYLSGIETGKIEFGLTGTSYRGGVSKQALQKYLHGLDERLNEILNRGDSLPEVDWFGRKKTAAEHLLYLADHELLHHGQWMVYRRLLGGSFPASWSAWGV